MTDLGTIDTATPVHPGKTDPPKKSISHNRPVNLYMPLTKVAGIPNAHERKPRYAHSFMVRSLCLKPLYPPK